MEIDYQESQWFVQLKKDAEKYRFILHHPELHIFETIWSPQQLDEAIVKAMKQEESAANSPQI